MSSGSLTKAETIKWLGDLRDAIPKGSERTSERTLSIWAARLMREPADVLAAVALVMPERYKFFPVLAEILEVCREIKSEGKTPTAGEAYEEVTTAMRRVGYYQPMPKFSHPAVANAVRAIGGWKYLCSSENSVSDRARFFEVYERFRERAFREETMPVLSRQVAAKYLQKIEDAAGKKIAAPRPRLVERKTPPRKAAKPKATLGFGMTEDEWRDLVERRKQGSGS